MNRRLHGEVVAAADATGIPLTITPAELEEGQRIPGVQISLESLAAVQGLKKGLTHAGLVDSYGRVPSVLDFGHPQTVENGEVIVHITNPYHQPETS